MVYIDVFLASCHLFSLGLLLHPRRLVAWWSNVRLCNFSPSSHGKVGLEQLGIKNQTTDIHRLLMISGSPSEIRLKMGFRWFSFGKGLSH